MPNSVRKWPDNCDPRNSCFCILGYQSSGVPPYTFQVKTTGATGFFALLNGAGITVTFHFQTGGPYCEYLQQFPPLSIRLRIVELGSPPYDPAPAATLEWALQIGSGISFQFANGSSSARFPEPTATPPPIDMVMDPGPDDIPNPVTLTPLPWVQF